MSMSRLPVFIAVVASLVVFGDLRAFCQDDAVEEIEEVEVVEAEQPGAEGVTDVIGRFHPMVVHLPIGWLLMVFLVDIAAFALRWHRFEDFGLFALAAAVAAFLPAVATGLLLNSHLKGGPDVHAMVETHETLAWFTLAVAAVALVVRLARRGHLSGAWKGAYLVLMSTGVILLMATGHAGGKLVFGSAWLPF